MAERAAQPDSRRFVILDRDGTIIEDREYLSDPQQVKLLPGAGAALRELRRMGFGLVVITNQSGIGRGFFDGDQLQRVHRRLKDMLRAEGVFLDGIYVCPHKPDDNCLCRKPKLGLLQKAAADLGFNIQDAVVIGDKASDIEMGRMAGAVTILVRTGYGTETAEKRAISPDFIVAGLPAAIRSIARLKGAAGTCR
jgi:D-glycero-D-manno-heptose 1,7-bisphosphate phosphatase